MRADLHTHSYYSDGRISPTELVREAPKAGLDVIALTDHENIGGIPEAVEAGKEFGLKVKVIPGIEFSVTDHEGKEQHLLGLFIDYKSQELKAFLAIWAKTKVQQIQAMLKNLKEKGFKIEFEDVAAQSRGSLNRSHIGYAIFERKENSALLDTLDVKIMRDFFVKILSEDVAGSAYVPRQRPPIKEVIGLIEEIGGTSVWAHPFWKKQDISEIQEKCLVFQRLGLEAIEVCYNSLYSSRESVLSLHQIAQKLGLYETTGSDFHSFGMHRFNKLGDLETFGLELRLPPGCEP